MPRGELGEKMTARCVSIEEEAEKIDEDDPAKATRVKVAVVRALLKKAKAGDVQAFREVTDRTDDRPRQLRGHSGEGGQAILLEVRVVDFRHAK